MIHSMITTLHKMQHHIQTTFGNSTQSPSHTTWQTPIARICQGNGVGPHIWAAVSSLLLDLMCNDGFYVKYDCGYILATTKLVGFAFVDDTDLCIFGTQANTSNVRMLMQQLVDNWEGLLCATGRALVPSKCFWYLIDFQYVNGTWKYISKPQAPGELQIKDANQERVAIP